EKNKVASLSGSAPPKTRASTNASQTAKKKSNESQLAFAHDLIGKSVVNSRAEKLGEISDLLIDLDERRPALVIISARGLSKKPPRFLAPLPVLNIEPNGKAIIDADRNTLDQAQTFNITVWQNMKDLKSYRYYEKKGGKE